MENIEDSVEYDLLLRKAKLLYPDVEEWVLKIAVKAYFNLGDKEFENDPNIGNSIKSNYFQGTEYKTPDDILFSEHKIEYDQVCEAKQ